jgi:hypothetical protein
MKNDEIYREVSLSLSIHCSGILKTQSILIDRLFEDFKLLLKRYVATVVSNRKKFQPVRSY